MRIDLSNAIATVENLLDELREMHDTEVDEAPTRASRRHRVHTRSTLQYLSHLSQRASVEVMDTYYRFKREDDSSRGDHG
ncbi:hypothetical protein [Streptomyces armeniacus]|uniref:hypothetical protein n=1 Tax=Streptomyces armeniacus TaxID=83291 RepID=UPI001AD7F252|nr:hypothetical protein [Streptomyces armeniacus]